MPLGHETTYGTSCQTNVSENIVETSTYRNIDLSSSASIVTSISNQWTQWKRIELIERCWARRYRSYLRDGRVGSFLLSVNPFHHGCSFVFSFVVERSRAGPACWRAQCVVACLFWCSLQHTREFSSTIAVSAWNISGRHWWAYCGIYFDRTDSGRPEGYDNNHAGLLEWNISVLSVWEDIRDPPIRPIPWTIWISRDRLELWRSQHSNSPPLRVRKIRKKHFISGTV